MRFPACRAIWLLVLGWALLLAGLPGAAQAQGPRPRLPRNLLEIALIPEVQRELKLDDARVSQLQQASVEMRARAQSMRNDVLNMSREDRDRRFQAFRTEAEKRVGEILDKRQMRRLEQLDLQLAGTRALGRPSVQDCLKFTPEQRNRVQAVFQAEHESINAIFQDFHGGPNLTADQREELKKRINEMRDLHSQTEMRLAAVLTEGQKRKFDAMQGPPFKFPDYHQRTPGGA